MPNALGCVFRSHIVKAMLIAVGGNLVPLVAICLLVSLIGLVFLARIGAPWLQAFTSGVPISIVEIVGMTFRKTNVRAVVRALVMARQAGTSLSRVEVERAYLQGVDLEKVTLAFIQARKEDLSLTFKEIVEADMEDRLSEKLRDR
jgi:uncharacterized protein YqfA (UPF0365 family)